MTICRRWVRCASARCVSFGCAWVGYAWVWPATLTMVLVLRAAGADLPDDRADIFYGDYKGGGMDVTTKSVLVRKKFSEQFSAEANYVVDKISGASIDVLSNASVSVIKDERKQKSLSLDWIHDNTQYNVAFTNSTKNDYTSNTTHVALSQDMFADLTTVSLGFTYRRNRVSENDRGIVTLKGFNTSRSFEAGISQIVTRNLITGLTLDVITDQGYLQNPYLPIRYADDSPRGWSFGFPVNPLNPADPVFPSTRTSTAVEARAKYYLPYRAAASVSYRYFNDTWGITGHTVELAYTQPLANVWILEGRVRLYEQAHADFYRDLFPAENYQNFETRDKNLASSRNAAIGAKATYAFLPDGWKIFKRGTATLDVSRTQYHYDDFRGYTYYEQGSGTEPLYRFSATVYQVYVSMFF